MKKIFKVLLITLILIFTACGKATEEQAREMLSQHLYERYGENFEIGWGGRDGYSVGERKVSWYEFNIKPDSYIGTNKENDKYYKAKGTVLIKKNLFGEKLDSARDTYGSGVLFKEQANEFYLPKLKELFGENVLPVLEITGSYSVKNKSFLENVKLTKERNREKNTSPLYIEGGIYIFGRVENDEDREWYREQIYKFVQFMKETGTFEYVSLGINIADERCLTDYFKKNIDNLLRAKQKYKTSSEFIAYRDEIFKEAEEQFKQMSEKEKQKRINGFNKSNLLESDIEGYGVVYHAGILSPKFKDSEPRAKSKRKDYNNIKDVELLNTMKILYMEYYRKENGEIVEK